MHYGVKRETHDVLVRPGYYTDDFRSYWQNQPACERDGCGRVNVSIHSKERLTTARWERFRKKPNPIVDEWADKYTCNAILVGVLGWVVSRKVRHIEDNHVVERTERKAYKNRPKHIVKGGTLYAECRYVCTYDAREYDPMEHC